MEGESDDEGHMGRALPGSLKYLMLPLLCNQRLSQVASHALAQSCSSFPHLTESWLAGLPAGFPEAKI